MKKGKKSTFNQGMVKTNRLQNKLTLAAGIVLMSLNTAWAASQCNVFDAEARRVPSADKNSAYSYKDTTGNPQKNTGTGSNLNGRTGSPKSGECNLLLEPWHPISHDMGNGQSIADSGDKIKLTAKGSTNDITEGDIALLASQKMDDDALFYIIDSKGVKQPTLAGFTFHSVGSFGSKTGSESYVDPITGATQPVSVYDNSVFVDGSELVTDRRATVPNASNIIGDRIYNQARFGSAKNGGELTVNLDGYRQQISMKVRNTKLFEASNGGKVLWEGQLAGGRGFNGSISLQPGSRSVPKPSSTDEVVIKDIYKPTKFKGSVTVETTTGPVSHNVANLADLQTFNTWLRAKINDGTLQTRRGESYQGAYDRIINDVVQFETFQVVRRGDPTASGTPPFDLEGGLPFDNTHVLAATGGSEVKLLADSVLRGTVFHYRQDENSSSTILVDDRSTGTIEEGARLYSPYNAVIVKNNSTFENKGVITTSSSLSPWEGNSDTARAVQVWNHSTFTNSGIINSSGCNPYSMSYCIGRSEETYAVKAGGTDTVVNNTGEINLYGANAGSAPGKEHTGIYIAADLKEVNNAGMIYIGRTAQFSKTPSTLTEAEQDKDDVTSTGDTLRGHAPGGEKVGILQRAKGDINHKDGAKIIIGSKTDNAKAIFIDGDYASTINLEDNSLIEVKGGKNHTAGVAFRTNYGLYAKGSGSSTITVDGDVKLTGINARAIQVEGRVDLTTPTNTKGSTVTISDKSEIELNGAMTNKTRNYGVYAEGFGNDSKAEVTNHGTIKLTGNGGIGLHARGHSEILNEKKGNVLMEKGEDQIGYFIHGPNASIKGVRDNLDVATDFSTMFRIAAGAFFDTKDMTITTNGKKSTAIVVTGESQDFYTSLPTNKKSYVSTAGGTYNITGEGSNFITVEGGAQADIDYSSKVSLTGKGAVIGIVDGQGYGLFRDPEGSIKSDSQLNSSLVTTSSLDNINTYVTRSKGNLNYTGSYINLYGKDSIAFKMQDGGRLKVAESASFIINGDAIRSDAMNEYSSVNRGETNTARLERNEINAINILNARSGAVTVDSRGQSLLTGAAQTESSANSRLSLSEETVWNITDNSKLTTLINRGTMNFVGQINDPKDRKQYHQLVIADDYLGVGGSTLSVNSNWYQTEGVFTNTVVIKGDAIGQTRVIATQGIGGDVKAPQAGEAGLEMLSETQAMKFDQANPVITVLGSDNFDNGNPTFIGEAVIRDSAELAQLVKKGKNYYWTMTATLPAKNAQAENKPTDTGEKLYGPTTAAYLQTPYINRQQSFDLLGKLTDRVGEQQFDCDCLGPQSWSRLSYHDGYSQGKNRFGFGSKRGLVQFGQDLSFNMNETRRVHTGISVGYSWSQNRFYDKYRSENGYISADKETLGSKSQVVGLGLYRTAYFANGSYLDLNLNGNWIHNQYKTENRHHKPSQNGYSLGASVETGRLFKLGESQWYVQPQAQLRAQYQHLNRFKDGSRQTEAKAQTGLQARLGARLTNGTFHVSADLVHDIIAPKTAVTIGNSRLEERYNPTTAELAVGGDIGLDSNGKWKLYSDAKYTRALGKANNVFGKKAPAESYNARIGVRYDW